MPVSDSQKIGQHTIPRNALHVIILNLSLKVLNFSLVLPLFLLGNQRFQKGPNCFMVLDDRLKILSPSHKLQKPVVFRAGQHFIRAQLEILFNTK